MNHSFQLKVRKKPLGKIPQICFLVRFSLFTPQESEKHSKKKLPLLEGKKIMIKKTEEKYYYKKKPLHACGKWGNIVLFQFPFGEQYKCPSQKPHEKCKPKNPRFS